MRNWKTNLGGAVTGLGLAIVAIDPEWAKAGMLVAAVGAFIHGLVGKDFNVSGTGQTTDGTDNTDTKRL